MRQPERRGVAAAGKRARGRRLDRRDRPRPRHGERRVPDLQADPRRGATTTRATASTSRNDGAASLGATVISNSWGGAEVGSRDRPSRRTSPTPGSAIFASSGDDGYDDGGEGPQYPSTSAHVTAVGGTTLASTSSSRAAGPRARGRTAAARAATTSRSRASRRRSARAASATAPTSRRSAIRTPASPSTTRRTAA